MYLFYWLSITYFFNLIINQVCKNTEIVLIFLLKPINFNEHWKNFKETSKYINKKRPLYPKNE